MSHSKPRPFFDLKEVKDLVYAPSTHVTFGRATKFVIAERQTTAKEAETFILNEINQLSENDFCSRAMIDEEKYDVYGKVIDHIPRYIKFGILDSLKGLEEGTNSNEDEDKDVASANSSKYLRVISFHPPEKTLITCVGVEIKTLETGSKDEN